MKECDADVLRDLEGRVRVLENVIEERQKMLEVTAENLDKRLVLLNELRSDVLTKPEYSRAHEALVERMERIEQTQAKFVGVAIVLVVLSGMLGGLIVHVVK